MLFVENLKNFRILVTDFKSCFMKRNLPFRLIKPLFYQSEREVPYFAA